MSSPSRGRAILDQYREHEDLIDPFDSLEDAAVSAITDILAAVEGDTSSTVADWVRETVAQR